MTLPDPTLNRTPHGSPIDNDGPRIPLFTDEFTADPHSIYREMRRRFGSLVPVELAPGVPATLVIGYRTAVQILNDPEHFPADPRIWQKTAPTDSPVLSMLEWRPSAQRSAGLEHSRYREADVAAIDAIDLHALHSLVERLAVPLINDFCQAGQADLVAQYTAPLSAGAINALLGCPPEIGQRIVEGFGTLDGDQGDRVIDEAAAELVRLKRTQPGDDLVSRLMAHPARLTDEEMLHQIVTLYRAGIEPEQHLITNTLRLMLTDERFAGGLLGGALPSRDALDEVLFTDPPSANFCVSYPRRPVLIDEVWLPAHQPVVVSLAACNNDPAVGARQFADNRAHLAWSIGPHACPARSAAYLIAQDAIDQLLDALPEMRLAVPVSQLKWRHGPFLRALETLPVVFTPSPPLPLLF
ncbi:cytochrome P450 [Nocardia sp. NPDC003482]|uniref:cytochrome P450 n=1 Tax=Nocardia sp. NPDC004068 TaxID=3364303 RepID=UPI003681CF67